MQTEERSALFEAVVAKYEQLGMEFEDDPGFRATVEEWITGVIRIDELQQRYRALSDMRRNVKALVQSSAAVHTRISRDFELDPTE